MSTEPSGPAQNEPPILAVEVKSTMLAWWGVIPVILFVLSQLVFGWPEPGRGIGFVPGYLIGRVLGGLTVATLFAWIVYRLSRRTQIAGTITFTIALLLTSLSTIATHFAPKPVQPTVQVTPPAQVAELSAQELDDFAGRYERAFASGDANAVARLIDFDTILDTGLAGLTVDREFLMGVKEGARPNYSKMFDQVVGQSVGGSFKYLRMHDVDGRKRLLFRLTDSSGRLNYHDLLVDRRDNRIVVIDMLFFSSGELFSQTWRRVMLPAAMQISDRRSNRLTPADRELLENYDKLGRINELRTQENSAEALRILLSFPQTMREMKPMRMMRMSIAAEVNEDEYLAALEDYRNAFPGDPALTLMELDYFLLRRDVESGLRGVDQLDQAVGGDPYLNSYRANFYIAVEQWSDARPFLEAFVKDFPEYQDGYWALAQVASGQQDFPLVIECFKHLDQFFEVPWEELQRTPEYAEFVNSAYYQEWLDYLAAKRSGLPTESP